MVHGHVLLEAGQHLGHLTLLLADGHIHTDQVLAFLVNYGVYGYGRLTYGPVPDDQLSLTPAYWNHGVDGFDTSLDRSVHGLAGDHVGGDPLHGTAPGEVYGTLAVQGAAQGVHHPADKTFPDGHFNDAPGGAYGVAFFHGVDIAHNGGPHRILFQVEGQSHDVVGEGQYFVIPGALESLDAGDSVGHFHHRAHVHQAQLGPELLDLALYYRDDVLSPGCHWCYLLAPLSNPHGCAIPLQTLPHLPAAWCG